MIERIDLGERKKVVSPTITGTYTAGGYATPICWWGFSSTSRFRDVVPADVKGETIHPERRLLLWAMVPNPRCRLVPGSLVSSPSSSLASILLALPINDTSRLASIHRTGKLFHRGGARSLVAESRGTDCAIPANRMSDNATQRWRHCW